MKPLSQESFASFVTSEAAVKSVLCEIPCSKVQNFQTRQKTKKNLKRTQSQLFSVIIKNFLFWFQDQPIKAALTVLSFD